MEPIMFQINSDKAKRSLTFQQFIKSELAQAIDMEDRLIGRTGAQEKELSKVCEQRKLVMMSALHLLEIFEKAASFDFVTNTTVYGVYIQMQNEQVLRDVAKLLAGAGFKLKPEDIKISESAFQSSKVVTPEQLDDEIQVLKNKSDTSTKDGSLRQSLTRLSYVLPCGFVEAQGRYIWEAGSYEEVPFHTIPEGVLFFEEIFYPAISCNLVESQLLKYTKTSGGSAPRHWEAGEQASVKISSQQAIGHCCINSQDRN
ncbi:hypothetical protein ACH5RR_036204 [Cinchona calisaya]|uniref:Uncharacterized protein n=1 Tax=Cinchona calisaya TaxID=153742 RepID=A0ABD2Y4I9_9GENT